jgi:hypothetical protein
MPWYVRNGQIEIKLASQDLSFLVVDRLTKKPLPGLTLSLGGNRVRTNVRGQANVDAPQLDLPLLISVDEPGYHPWRKALLRLPVDSAESPLVVELDPHVFNGVVLEAATQQPLAGVTVATGEFSLQTDQKVSFPSCV